MGKFINTSVGRKYLVSLSGLFLISFLAVHLTVNLFLLAGEQAYNAATHFMGTNTVIGIIEPLLAVGFLVHIIYSVILTISNRFNRPVKYSMVDQSETSSWSSRNMFVLGGLIFIFLVLHLSNFWYIMKFGEMAHVEYDGVIMEDAYSLVTGKFVIWWYVLIYVAGAIFLGLHLLHGFQSSFQSLGLSDKLWKKRLALIGMVYTFIITFGFGIIPVYFYIGTFLN
ncbi:MAG: succinate dehydrogenase cytochrome b subunit [Bacteroidales bacterium]